MHAASGEWTHGGGGGAAMQGAKPETCGAERECAVTHPLLVTSTRPCVAASHWLAPDLSRAVIGGETSSTPGL